ncbi:MAG: sigma-54-dependent transcriptional regulator [Candidatus Krumholzibacteriia bacterium]
MPLRVLLVDDDRDFGRRFETLARGTFDLHVAHTFQEGIALVRRGALDAVLLDIDLQEERTGLDLLREIRQCDPDLPVIMLSGDDRPETIDRAIRAGAEGYTRKHCNLGVLHTQIEHNLENVMWRQHARALEDAPSGLIGACPAIAALRREIDEVAGTSLRVLIRGESGSGKEVVAHAIHGAGQRRHGRFVTVNAACGTDDLFDDLFFGHETGSFTGAHRQRIGKLEVARHGTLFIDEVGKMNLGRQAKLLRVMEEGAFERVGGADAIATDTRFVCASNEDLERSVAEGRFYPDFYYRIREYELVVPPLRDRFADLPEIMRFLADRFCAREARARVEIAGAAVDACRGYAWPGNVRELDSALKRAIVAADGELTDPAIRAAIARVRPEAPEDLSRAVRWDDARTAWERAFIGRALVRHGGSVERAAREMDLSRSTLYAKLQQYGLGGRRDPDDGP